jgi:uncharacterized protein YecT (DUF1311 family)
MQTFYFIRGALSAALAALALFYPSFAAAQSCKNPETQMAMNACAARDYDREDTRLNKTYRDLLAKLEPAKRDKLREVQRVWLSFRDLSCDFQSTDYQGGTIYSLVQSSCLADMTKQRTKDLNALLEEAGR